MIEIVWFIMIHTTKKADYSSLIIFPVIDHFPPWCLNICGSFVECKQRPDRRTLFLRVEMHDAYGIAYDSCLKPVDVP